MVFSTCWKSWPFGNALSWNRIQNGNLNSFARVWVDIKRYWAINDYFCTSEASWKILNIVYVNMHDLFILISKMKQGIWNRSLDTFPFSISVKDPSVTYCIVDVQVLKFHPYPPSDEIYKDVCPGWLFLFSYFLPPRFQKADLLRAYGSSAILQASCKMQSSAVSPWCRGRLVPTREIFAKHVARRAQSPPVPCPPLPLSFWQLGGLGAGTWLGLLLWLHAVPGSTRYLQDQFAAIPVSLQGPRSSCGFPCLSWGL